MDPRTGRQKHVTEGGKGVQKRGSGLGTGPVGRKEGYAGRTSQGSSQQGGGSGRPVNRGQRSSGGGKSPLLLVVVVVIVIALIAGGRGCGGSSSGVSSGGNTYNNNSTGGNQGNWSPSGYSGAQTTPSNGGTSSGQSTQLAYGSDLFGMLSGFTGSNGVSSGWSTGSSNVSALNREVDAAARAKRTQIIGNGQDSVTIMIYMCGTDLESKSGMATRDMMEMCSAKLADNVNILIYTGGCRGWRVNGISNSVNQIYRVTNGGLERLVDDDGSKGMTDPETLTAFIQWCAANFPANRNDLIFWDHGSGSVSGYGYDEKFPNKGSMTLSGINRALKNSGVTFDFIGFDACLMATLETALVTSNYADYLIASEETEPGIGWYYSDWLSSLSQNTSQETIDTGKNIIDGFVEKCGQECSGQKATLSIIDLAELEKTVPSKLSAFSGSTADLIRSDNYKKVSDARAGTREFAASSRIDQIDLVDFANKIGTEEASALADTLLGAVKYNRTSANMTNSYGVSIYFPYKRTSKVDSVTSMYEDIGMDEEYAECIRSFAGIETAGQLSAGGYSSPFGALTGSSSAYSEMTTGSDALSALLSAFLSGGRSAEGIDRSTAGFMEDSGFDVNSAAQYISVNQFDPSMLEWYEDDQGRHLIALPDEAWDQIQTLQVNMFYDDGEGYVDLGLDTTWEFTDDGRLIGDTDDTWLSIDKQPAAFYYETTIIDGDSVVTTGRVPAYLDGERVNLILVFDDETPYGRIAGANYVYLNGETETVAKNITEIEEGAEIQLVCDYYNYDGQFEEAYLLGEPLYYHDGMEISNTYLGENTSVMYLLTDFYNNEYFTPAVPK